MNVDVLQGKWKQMKGEVKAWWGQLTDDEVEQVNGRTERLLGLLQERYGYTKGQAWDQINYFLEDVERRMKSQPDREKAL